MQRKAFKVLIGALFIMVAAGNSFAVTHTVNQVSLTFDPPTIDIQVGDTVEWIWSGGSHTVTNGVDLDDPDLGVLFDAPLNSVNPSFSYTFAEPGEYPYLCRPHFLFNMTGVVNVAPATPVSEKPQLAGLALFQNSPNPFNPSTQIVFEIPGTSGTTRHTSLRIYNLQGRLVRTLVSEPLAPARHTVIWNGRNDNGEVMASGVYVYRLSTEGLTVSRQMTLMK
jgi:plastocyanin